MSRVAFAVSPDILLRLLLSGTLLLMGSRANGGADDAKKAADNIKEVSGTAEFLRSLPKRFAFLQNVNPASHQVTLLIEGESLSKTWPLADDAEIKFHGWWGRLDQFTPGDRVWVWFRNDRGKQPAAVAMLADEISEEDIHGSGLAVLSRDTTALTVQSPVGKDKGTVRLARTAVLYRGGRKVPLDAVKTGDKIYIQSTAAGARLIVDQGDF